VSVTAQKIRETAGPTNLTVGAVADGEFLVRSGTTIVGSAGGGGGAPTSASYVVIGLNGSLSAERVLTAGTGLTLSDGGANGNATLAPDFGTGAGKVTEGNDARLSDSRAPNGAASGDLAGTYPSPTVTQARGLRETSGPTTLTLGAVADGEFLVRSGSTVVGAAGGSGLTQPQVMARACGC
jgi:hypothetical protein